MFARQLRDSGKSLSPVQHQAVTILNDSIRYINQNYSWNQNLHGRSKRKPWPFLLSYLVDFHLFWWWQGSPGGEVNMCHHGDTDKPWLASRSTVGSTECIMAVRGYVSYRLSVTVMGDCRGWGCVQPVTVSISPGGRLNKKDGLTRYGNSHVKDKTS